MANLAAYDVEFPTNDVEIGTQQIGRSSRTVCEAGKVRYGNPELCETANHLPEYSYTHSVLCCRATWISKMEKPVSMVTLTLKH